MANEAWRRGMLSLMSRHWGLPLQLGALRERVPDHHARTELCWQTEVLAALINSSLWLMSDLQPLGGLYTTPLIETNDARKISRRAASDRTLSPHAQLYAAMTSVQIAANCLTHGFTLMAEHRHATGLDAARFREAGDYLAVPAGVCAGMLEHLRVVLASVGDPAVCPVWRGAVHLTELLARASLHLLCVGAVGRPASTGLPSALLPPAGREPGPWPGWDRWLREWAGRFPGPTAV